MNPNVLLVTVFAFTAIVFGFALSVRFRAREMDHKLKLAAIEKGVAPPVPQSAPWTPRTYLLHGMIWLFVGIASFVALVAVAATSQRQESQEERIAAVSEARFRGATPEEIQILLNAPRQQVGIPVGLAFLGLIPTAVGVAYLIFYRIENKKLVN